MDVGFVEVFADENELAFARFAFFPEAIPEDREAIIHSMENRAARVSGDADETFRAIDFFFFAERLDEELEFFHAERLLKLEGERFDVVVMPRVEFVEELRIDGELLIYAAGDQYGGG